MDLSFEEPPTILNTSRRDYVEVVEQVLLVPDLPPLERDRIEREILEKHDLSALVDNLAGLSTYPTIVTDQTTLRSALRTSVHEWLHAYLFFRPLGWNWNRSPEMFSLNETVAELAGNELGDEVFARMGGRPHYRAEPVPSPPRAQPLLHPGDARDPSHRRRDAG